MTHRRLFGCLVGAVVFAATAGPAGSAAGKGPIVPSSAPAPSGVSGPPGTAAAELRYSLIPNSRGHSYLLTTRTDGGEIQDQYSLSGSWALPAVTTEGDPGGLSADGGTLVLIEPNYVLGARRTSFLALDTDQLGEPERFTLSGRFGFDAISPDGRTMYLIEYRDRFDPLDYRVRGFDLSTGELTPGSIVDPSEPDEAMSGIPVARQTSADGRWAYTLYAGGKETFVHALDTEEATAVCVDLAEFNPKDALRFELGVSPDSGTISVLRRGDPAAVIDPETFEVASPADSSPASDGEGNWAVWALIGGGLLLCLGVIAVQRRWRRGATAEGGM